MAEVESLLREAEEERDAVRGAMKVVRGENRRLRELSAGAAKKAEEKATEEGTKTEDVDQTPLKGHGKTEVSAKGTKREVVGPDAQPKPEPNKVQASPANESEPEPQGAESDMDNAHTCDDELDEHPSNDGHLAKPVADIPSMPGSSSELWKGQVRDREVTLPKTPPHVHPLPVETSPWAEGQA
ncbi:hypothetical protein RSAG8_13645, partial [Rhizoctonia solani AG-8 WAC10335]